MSALSYLTTRIDWQKPEVADAYDSLPFWGAPFGNLFFQHVPLRQGMTVLDVGFGTGFPLLELAGRLGPESKVYGIDPWSEAVARARRKAAAMQISNIEIVEADAAHMPFEDGQFDMLVSQLGINNFDQKDAVLEECVRVLKKDATLVLVTNLNGTFREFYQLFYKSLNQLQLSQYVAALQKQENHRPTIPEVQDWLENYGFHIEKSIPQTEHMRYANGTAFLHQPLIIMGFLPAWLALFPPSEHVKIFSQLESNLNLFAQQKGELKLELPMLYLQAQKG